jgi:anti-repressor protein
MFLGIGTEYAKWFERMCEYGFSEGVDFNSVVHCKMKLHTLKTE